MHAGGIGPDDRMLHYFNGTFYSWDRAWRGLGLDEIQAVVTRDLQDRSGIDAVTVHLVQNVLLNHRGLCVVAQGKEPLPFYIADYGPPTVIRRRQFLVLQNGMLDLDRLAQGQEPELMEFNTRWFGTTVLPFAYDPGAKCRKFEQFLCRVLECYPQTGLVVDSGEKSK